MGALVIAAIFSIIVSVTSGIYPLQDQPKSEIDIILPGTGPGYLQTVVNPASEINKGHLIKQGYDYSCGSAALAIILNFYLGENFTEKQVIQGLLHYGNSDEIAKRQAFSLLDMKKFVQVLGYKGEGYKADLEDLKSVTTPCIVPIKILNYRHFVVFRGIHNGHIFFADPWRGDISFTLNEFNDMWYEKVFFVVSAVDGPVLNNLRLKPEDLKYIDEDAVRIINAGDKTNTDLAEEEREFRLLINNPGTFQYYRPKR
ncbi:MAG TPA: C39 family peptidase [Smithella sp.]|nr:C39 family peptidase [Smithella sp.]